MIGLLNDRYMKHAVTLTLLFALAGCGIDQQADTKTIKVAELKGERAGIEKEIELQTSALADIQARLDATHPGERTRDGFIVTGPNPDWFRQQYAIRQRLIVLQSQMAKIDEEVKVLAPGEAK